MPVSTALLRRFEDLSKQDVDYAGGKGANLGEMTAAGLPVPPASWSVPPPTPSFATWVGCATASRSSFPRWTWTTRLRWISPQRRSARWSRRSLSPDEVASEIRDAYLELAGDRDNPPVAVRSSATAEDTEAASFAGMNETFLNVRGPDEVVDAVRDCWSSLFGARTVFYRAKQGFGQADMDIAVVVQIPDPLHPRRRHVHDRPGLRRPRPPRDRGLPRPRRVGRLGLGLPRPLRGRQGDAGHPEARGEAQGAGDRATPRRRHPHAGALRRRVDSAGPHGRRGAPRRRARYPDEKHYGTPQDTEWAFDEEGIAWMLQSRPVTSSGGDTSEEPPSTRARPWCAAWARRPASATAR